METKNPELKEGMQDFHSVDDTRRNLKMDDMRAPPKMKPKHLAQPLETQTKPTRLAEPTVQNAVWKISRHAYR